MSPLIPSFHTIYRQGRFRAHQIPEGKKMIQQGERFAVACLGFVLHHDEPFRAHFLRCICDWPKPDTAKEFCVLVELDGCGDLALKAETLGVVFVLECKIGADVKFHQDPDSQSFFNGGYGSGVLSNYDDDKWKPNYITLTQERLKKAYQASPKLAYKSKTWADLRESRTPASTSGLVDDLFKTFAEHHIHCFADWNMKTRNLKLAPHYLEACKVGALLQNTASLIETRFGLTAEGGDNCAFDPERDSFIGRGLKCKYAPREWLTLTGLEGAQNTDWLAWFGYALGGVQVGLYCKDGAVEKVIQMLQKIKGAGEQASEHDDDGYVWINTPDNPAAGDQEWIISVFDRLHQQIGT